jgi:hypothetical protein
MAEVMEQKRGLSTLFFLFTEILVFSDGDLGVYFGLTEIWVFISV